MKELSIASYIICMNNSFNENISNICGMELSALAGGYKYSVFSGNAVVVEGHKGIVGYSSEEVLFAVNKTFLQVTGTNLQIRCMEKHFAVIIGKIHKVEVKRDEK